MCTYCKLAADRCDSGPRRSGEESGFSPDRRGPESEAPRARAQSMHIAPFSQYGPCITFLYVTSPGGRPAGGPIAATRTDGARADCRDTRTWTSVCGIERGEGSVSLKNATMLRALVLASSAAVRAVLLRFYPHQYPCAGASHVQLL